MARGNVYDVKRAFVALLTGTANAPVPSVGVQVADGSLFLALIAALATERGIDQPFAASGKLTVFDTEKLSKLVFPMAEVIAYVSTYEPDTIAKVARHRIGIRWSTVEPDEALATAATELLIDATTAILWGDITTRGTNMADVELNAGPVTVVEEDYAPLLPTENHAFVKSATVIVELTTYRQ